MTFKRMMIAAVGATLMIWGAPAAAQADNATPEARRALAVFSQCVAKASPDKTAQTLASDFTERRYSAALRALATTNATCLKLRGTTMRATGLPFAGALAEAMLLPSATPLKIVLAKGATAPCPAAYSTTDAAALCVVRSTPDDVAALFSSGVASAEEQALLTGLRPVYARCAAASRIEVTDVALRAMLATAAFRVTRSVPA